MSLVTPDLSTAVLQEADNHRDSETLQLVRRLDWRFLLPYPDLGRVAYCGPSDDELLKALSAFCDHVVVLNGQEGATNGVLFDTVVVRLCPPDRLPALVNHLRPGGVLYAEWYNRPLPPRVRRELGGKAVPVTSPRAVLRTLASCGNADVRLYWHWPSFTACTRIVPWKEDLSLAYVAGGPESWLGAVARWLWRRPFVCFFVPCFSSVVWWRGNR